METITLQILEPYLKTPSPNPKPHLPKEPYPKKAEKLLATTSSKGEQKNNKQKKIEVMFRFLVFNV